ncbi:MAG: hypothetical protein DMG41_34170 [Acidobacteria bacterium]|nr:MAG: hypothetical protein DMG42_34990 [Acidobacteriota bacterium]PYT81970.1 MAG: hypothetical protein DMG41_34170 [Acidobacteriota bacterium]
MSDGEEVAHDKRLNLDAVWHRVGLERPHFVATETVAVAPAQQVEVGINTKRVAPACGARIRRKPVKRVRIAFFSFVFSGFFTLR